ncbi:MAG: TetR/AcrR family transcriptional regulator [Paracoccaceae bacterium]|nr:TetR/AcrR family transcriptional regulator [Paracoccaceae bacterium]
MEKQDTRRAQIETAAFEVLEQMGYKKANILQIARRAKASNETLDARHANKQALFSTLIASNAKTVREIPKAAISGQSDLAAALNDTACLLLQFTAIEKAVIFNRVAVTGLLELGPLVQKTEKNARQVMYRILEETTRKWELKGGYVFDDVPKKPAATYVILFDRRTLNAAILGHCATAEKRRHKRFQQTDV